MTGRIGSLDGRDNHSNQISRAATVAGQIDIANPGWQAIIGLGQLKPLAGLPVAGGLLLRLEFRLVVPNRLRIGARPYKPA